MDQNTKSSGNFNENYRTGTRCQICTGCGRCFGVRNDIHVLTNMPGETGRMGGCGSEDAQGTGTSRRAEDAQETGRLIIVDIGTTTIAMQLYGMDGKVLDTYAVVNPQTEYGADVLSRIQAAENPEDAQRMKESVRKVLREGIDKFRNFDSNKPTLQDLEKDTPSQAFRMVIAANTTMVYLLMGYDTAELGKAPFHARYLQPIQTEIEGIPCHIFGGLSAFVGGDITSGIQACGMAEQEEITLLIDLGTNGETVLGNRDKMLACSTAAGPAFEGGVNRGVWGADMISLLARLRREEILDETGLLEDPYFEEGIRIGDVLVTQESVRAIQLAKGAILAGIRILVREYGITMEQIDKVVLSGGFGYYLNPTDAAEIGLIPFELQEKTIPGGNTALSGALKLGRKWKTSEPTMLAAETATETQIRTKIRTINLAEMDGFEDLYIESMNLCRI